MADHIPFVNSSKDWDILKTYYKDSDVIRVSLESIGKRKKSLPQNMSLWIDPAIDTYHHILTTKWLVDIRTQSPADSPLWPVYKEGKEKGQKKDSWKIDIWKKW